MLRLAILALALTLVSASLHANWQVYKNTYNKIYTEDEDGARRLIWQTNLQKIEQHNELYAQGLSTFYVAENQFTDMTIEEMKAKNDFNTDAHIDPSQNQPSFNTDNLPKHIDWREMGVVTPAKDQGNCSSAWAFSATGSLEAQYALTFGTFGSLSESNLIDCSQEYGNNGCQGGTVNNSITYIFYNNGIDTEESYPYKPEVGPCKFDPKTVGATLLGITFLGDNEYLLQFCVAMVGPISAVIDDSDLNFHHYKGGIYDNPNCKNGTADVHHDLLVIGYGSQDGKDYWIVKNSWGQTWGDKGFGLMSRNKNNQCGIASRAVFPITGDFPMHDGTLQRFFNESKQ